MIYIIFLTKITFDFLLVCLARFYRPLLDINETEYLNASWLISIFEITSKMNFKTSTSNQQQQQILFYVLTLNNSEELCQIIMQR